LTSILRKAEKTYYSTILINNKNDIKFTWKVLNTIIRKHKKSQTNCDTFKINNVEEKDKTKIANGFNEYFANIGPKLANNIPLVNSRTVIADVLGNLNVNCLFLKNVDKEEILNIVRKFKNKTSLDADNTNMEIIKKVITSIID